MIDRQTTAYLDDLGLKYERGHREALVMALRFCAMRKIPLPDWLARRCMDAVDQWLSGDVQTLDEGLEIKLKKRERGQALKQRLTFRFLVYSHVLELRDQGRALDTGLFDEVGEQFGIGKTLCEEYYRDALRWFQQIPGSPLQYARLIPGRKPVKKRSP